MFRNISLAAALDVTAFCLFNYSVTQAAVWYVAAIVTSQSLVTVALAGVFLGERLTLRQWVGLVLFLVGLVAVQWAAGQ